MTPRVGVMPQPPKRLARIAAEYLARGWPAVRLAAPRNGRCQCGDTCAQPHLLDEEPIRTSDEAEQNWGEFEIAFTTQLFEVLDLPAHPGVALNAALTNRCPTAVARPGRRFDTLLEPGPVRWHFYLSRGSVDPEKVTRAGGRLHCGPDGWIAAPPSRTPATGRVRWNVHPMQTLWRPHRPASIFES
ncbi:bifunctional DNA primase/polymerase [Nocardioides sp. NPDC051685]|uniref:bifunctional DNA primase/polymerase n=1 Tax=Nocardioides sp. NPDC051685 TaxID=3364334 RepID=UPI0037A5C2A8